MWINRSRSINNLTIKMCQRIKWMVIINRVDLWLDHITNEIINGLILWR